MSEQQRQQEQHAQQMKSFAGAFARGQANALDRFGNPMAEGDKLMLRFQVDPIVDVVSVNPVLDPRAQPGTIQVMCTVTFPLIVMAGKSFQFANIVARRQAVEATPSNGTGPQLVDPPAVDADPSGDVEPIPPTDDDDPIIV